MSANPVLVNFIRGNMVENQHRGAFCVSTSTGRILASAGDVGRPVFPRSAIKALQALPFVESGAPERFALGSQAIALACASHHGEPEHVSLAGAVLNAIGLDESALECGTHPPSNARARAALRDRGETPSALHNNCSGKHAGMLALGRMMAVETAGYVGRSHPVQQRVRSAVEGVIAVPLSEDRCGTDGCSIPTWGAPLSAFASGFARFATGDELPPRTAQAARTIWDAVSRHPHLIAGTDAFDTEAIAAFKGDLLVKIGADGVFCGAIRSKGIGFALKCDDGHRQASIAMVAALLEGITESDEGQRALLNRFAVQPQTNWRGIEVGRLEGTQAARPSL